jgi:hypothetical protein
MAHHLVACSEAIEDVGDDGNAQRAQTADLIVVLDIGSDDASIICSVRLPVMRRHALPFVLLVVVLAAGSGCGADRPTSAARIETELRRSLAANPDYDFTVACIERESGGYGCSVQSGPVGVPASEDDAYSFVGLADVTCDGPACQWRLTSGTRSGPATGSFRVDG